MPRPARHSREDSIHAAMELFWLNGYHTTSLKDLEQALQMKPGSIYAAFQSKEALFCEVLDTYANMQADAMQAIFDAAPDPLTGLVNFIEYLITCEEITRTCLLSKTILETSATQGPAQHKAQTLMGQAQQKFAEVFAQAQQAGEIAPDHDPARLARKFQADLTGARVTASQSDTDPYIQELLQEVLEWLQALRAPASVS